MFKETHLDVVGGHEQHLTAARRAAEAQARVIRHTDLLLHIKRKTEASQNMVTTLGTIPEVHTIAEPTQLPSAERADLARSFSTLYKSIPAFFYAFSILLMQRIPTGRRLYSHSPCLSTHEGPPKK
jgi:hypothetical protein